MARTYIHTGGNLTIDYHGLLLTDGPILLLLLRPGGLLAHIISFYIISLLIIIIHIIYITSVTLLYCE